MGDYRGAGPRAPTSLTPSSGPVWSVEGPKTRQLGDLPGTCPHALPPWSSPPLQFPSLLSPLPSLPILPSHPFWLLFLSLWVSLKRQVTLGHQTQSFP